MSLKEIEENIDKLPLKDRAYLTYKLIKNLQDSEDDYSNIDFYEELESRNNDDPTYFVDGAEVMREAKSKYQ